MNAGIVALLCLTSCSTGPDVWGTVTDSPEEVVLELPGEPGAATAGVPPPAVDQPLSVGMDPVVCLSGPGSVTITGVRGRGATANLAVEDFAVRSNPSLTGDLRLGEERVPLAEAGFEQVVGVLREDATLEVDRSVFFTSDRVAVQAVLRAGFAHPHPQGVVKITAA